MKRLLKNIIKLQLGKNLKLQLELRPLLKVELLNNKDFDALTPKQREYISNVYAKENLNESFLKNGLKPEQRGNLNLQRLVIYEETGNKITQKQLKHIQESFIAIVPENQSTVNELVIQAEKHYQSYKQLGSKQDYKMYKELMLSVSSLCQPIEFENKRHTVKQYTPRIDVDDYTYDIVRGLLKNYSLLRNHDKCLAYYLDIEQALQVVKLTDKQIELLYDLIHNNSIDKDNSRSLHLCIDKLVHYLNNYNIYHMNVINDLCLFI